MVVSFITPLAQRGVVGDPFMRESPCNFGLGGLFSTPSDEADANSGFGSRE
jgi:hypothetical protein